MIWAIAVIATWVVATAVSMWSNSRMRKDNERIHQSNLKCIESNKEVTQFICDVMNIQLDEK